MLKKPSATKWHRKTAPVAKPGEPLTRMEIKILDWCSKGDTKARTGRRLGISESYVKYFFERIYIKLRVRTRGMRSVTDSGGYAICGCAAARQGRHEDAICQDQRSKLNRFEEISHLCSCC